MTIGTGETARAYHSEAYDVVVLGAGSGGYTAAVRCAQLGLRTAIVEEGEWGGVCLNRGCIPSKALLHNADLARLLTTEAPRFGISAAAPIEVDYATAVARSRQVVAARVKGVHFLTRKNGIDEYNGHGKFLDPTSLLVTGTSGRQQLTFRHAIIAVGATTRMLAGTGVSERVVTYSELIVKPEVPQSIAIIGAGPIGVEFAYLMRSFGSKVTLVETANRLMPAEDIEVSKELQRQFTRSSIRVLTGSTLDELDEDATGVSLRLKTPTGAVDLRVSTVLQAIGFTPRADGYGLDRTLARVSPSGAIEVDDNCRTSVDHIYAIGDVTGKLMLAHVADTMGIVAAESIGRVPTQPLSDVDFQMMPRATFCSPQIASFGYTEEAAIALGHDVQVARFPFSANGKAPGIGSTAGFVKILCDRTYGELLGAHLVGPDVSELLPELTLARQWDLTVHELARNVHTHPTLGEAVKEALHGLAGHMINL